MTRELAHLCARAPRVARELAVDKRASVQAPVVSGPMTSAHLCGAAGPARIVLLQVIGVGSPP